MFKSKLLEKWFKNFKSYLSDKLNFMTFCFTALRGFNYLKLLYQACNSCSYNWAQNKSNINERNASVWCLFFATLKNLQLSTMDAFILLS